MAQPQSPVTEVIAANVRARRPGSAAQLAARCAEVGAPRIDRDVIAKLESGRRANVTVDELLALATALDTSPIDLLTPPPDQAEVEITPAIAVPVGQFMHWFSGLVSLPEQDNARWGASNRRFRAVRQLERYTLVATMQMGTDRYAAALLDVADSYLTAAGIGLDVSQWDAWRDEFKSHEAELRRLNAYLPDDLFTGGSN